MSDFFDQQSDLIEEFGWAVVHVLPTDEDPADAVPFGYTVGLTGYGHPEIAISGVPPEVAHPILNELASRVCDEGLQLRHGRRIRDLIVDHDVVIVAGEPTEEVFPGVAVMRYGERVRLRQVVWPDPGDRFPWQSGYETAGCPQPTIGAAEPRAAARCGTFRGFPRGRTRAGRSRR